MGFRGEREQNRVVDPVIAFLHDRNNPPAGMVDISSGKIVPYVPLREQHRFYGPPLPTILTDLSTGAEIELEEQVAITELLGHREQAEAQNHINHERRPLSIRRLAATAVLPLLG